MKATQVLKAFFERRESDGVWSIANLKGIPLITDRDDAPSNFYKIRDDVLVLPPNQATTIRSAMGQSIVPIVANVRGENELKCLGTGFFISCSGLLITAAHVIADPIERKYGGAAFVDHSNWQYDNLNLGVMIATNPILQVSGFFFRKFEWCGFLAEQRANPLPFRGIDLKLSSDIAICKVQPIDEQTPYQPLSIVQPGIQGRGMRVGSNVTALGYSGMMDTQLEARPNGAVIGDFKFDLYVSKGRIIEQFPDNLETKTVSTPGPCFSVEAKLSPGMSGSPIFDEEGLYVHAVASKGTDFADDWDNLGYGSMLLPSMSLPLTPLEGQNILQLLTSNSHGIPKIYGCDF